MNTPSSTTPTLKGLESDVRQTEEMESHTKRDKRSKSSGLSIDEEEPPSKRQRQPLPSSLLCEDSSLEPPSLSCEYLDGSDDKDETQDSAIEVDHTERSFMQSRQREYGLSSDIWSIQTEVKPLMRAVMSQARGIQRETCMYAIDYLDRFLSLEPVTVDRLQILGVTCIFLASKIHETEALTVSDVAPYCDEDDMDTSIVTSMEELIVNRLQWKLTPSTPYHFLRLYLNSCSQDEFPMGALIYSCQMVDYFHLHSDSTKFSSEHIAAAVFCLFAIQKQVTGFSVESLQSCCAVLYQLEELFTDASFAAKLKQYADGQCDGQIHNRKAMQIMKGICYRRNGARDHHEAEGSEEEL
ncbi:G1/S-specific cyclin-D1 [Planoprotostelium fungivorum]|uniref:G1/S-specific cyclin-D1 n=1 Tax=Planoprotostelium fungivorum TaxID=1890364 RepID=A0A2P6NQ75_9EUKA|nr:G1/S-specific cyclin-D1 [Planoprotostelium fungivorum]